MRRGGDHVRIYGPYQHGRKWRIVARGGGRQSVATFATRDEAERAIEAARQEAQGRTIRDAVKAYMEHKARLGLEAISLDSERRRIVYWFREDLDAPLGDVTASKERRRYEAHVERYAVDTHRNMLVSMKTFGAFLTSKGWLPRNLWEGIEGVGQRGGGKEQLTIDEARQLYEECMLALDQDGDVSALAVLLMLLLGYRVSEVLKRVGRDVDDGGRLLRVAKGKTRNAKRAQEVPEALRPYLAARAQQVGALGRLIPYGRHWADRWVKRWCRRAGVTEVCCHGLRGTHSTLALEAGATAQLVATALGHGSTKITEMHYFRPGASADAHGRRVAALVTGNGPFGYQTAQASETTRSN